MSLLLQHILDIALGVISAALVAGYGLFMRQIRHSIRERRSLRAGLQALLRDRIVQEYHDCLEKSSFPVHVQQNVDELLEAYKSLGGNGTIPGLVDKLKHLPIEQKNTEEK